MLRLSPVRLALCSIVLAVSACASNPPHGADAGPQVTNGSSAAGRVSGNASLLAGGDAETVTHPAAAIASAEVGSIVPLAANNALGVSRVRVVDEYRAASGRLCRRVQLPRNTDSIRVACERGSGQWSFTRALVSSGISERIYSGRQ
jgi:hypothetical protein